jgi:hypothetical protein
MPRQQIGVHGCAADNASGCDGFPSSVVVRGVFSAPTTLESASQTSAVLASTEEWEA